MSAIKETVFKEISVRGEHGIWARLFWEESTGRVTINSDYGDWSYCWSSIGKQTLQSFLAGLDSHYMGKKMLGQHYDVPDDEGTVQAIKEMIIQMRRDGEFDKDAAREEWDNVKAYARGDCDFRGWCDDTNITEAWEVHQTKADNSWVMFWEKLWVPLIVPILRGDVS